MSAPRPQPGTPEAAREAQGPEQRGEQAGGSAPAAASCAPLHLSLTACPATERAAKPGPPSPATPATMSPRAARSRPAPRPPRALGPPYRRLPCPSSCWTNHPSRAAAAREEEEEASLRRRRPASGARGGTGARGGKGRDTLCGCARGWGLGWSKRGGTPETRSSSGARGARPAAGTRAGGGLGWLVAEARSPRSRRGWGGVGEGPRNVALPQRNYLAVVLNNRSPREPATLVCRLQMRRFGCHLKPRLKACSCGSKAALGPGKECAGLNLVGCRLQGQPPGVVSHPNLHS